MYKLAKYLGEGTEPGASGESPMLLFSWNCLFGSILSAAFRGVAFGHEELGGFGT